MSRRSIVLCSLTAGAILVFGACGSEDTPAAPPPASSGGADRSASAPAEPSQTPSTSPSTIEKTSGVTSAKIIDTDFRPLTITVAAGSRIKWTQIGDQPHSVSAVDDSFDSSPKCGPLDSDMCLGEGDTFSHRFQKPGEFLYYCRVHGLPDGTGMVGTVIVE